MSEKHKQDTIYLMIWSFLLPEWLSLLSDLSADKNTFINIKGLVLKIWLRSYVFNGIAK